MTSNLARIKIKVTTTACGVRRRTTFPRRPTWWDEPDASVRRTEVIDDFSQAELVHAMDALRERLTDSPTTVETVASYLRRLWTLRWFAELGRAKMSFLTEDPPSAWVLYWQHQTADALADSAWLQLMASPALLIDVGIRKALNSPSEDEIMDNDCSR